MAFWTGSGAGNIGARAVLGKTFHAFVEFWNLLSDFLAFFRSHSLPLLLQSSFSFAIEVLVTRILSFLESFDLFLESRKFFATAIFLAQSLPFFLHGLTAGFGRFRVSFLLLSALLQFFFQSFAFSRALLAVLFAFLQFCLDGFDIFRPPLPFGPVTLPSDSISCRNHQ